jgi:hypothetical protein
MIVVRVQPNLDRDRSRGSKRKLFADLRVGARRRELAEIPPGPACPLRGERVIVIVACRPHTGGVTFNLLQHTFATFPLTEEGGP